ncbi:MAG: hypothetical protein PHE50_06045, partial [Dehalococcoidales bacterium]|nr:hypothetical protein [Dehalococcoidales bacterium]
MKKTWKPQTAGILTIVSGVIGLLASFGMLIAIAAVGSAGHWVNDWNGYYEPNVLAILWTIGIPMFLSSVVALVGGIFAVQRKFWGMALAGSIAAFFPTFVLGLLAVIFT